MIGSVAALSLAMVAAPAQACSLDAYMTPEELDSGNYDRTPPPWEGGEAHSHDVPTATTTAPAPPASTTPPEPPDATSGDSAPEAPAATAHPQTQSEAPGSGPTTPAGGPPPGPTADGPSGGTAPQSPAALPQRDARGTVGAPASAVLVEHRTGASRPVEVTKRRAAAPRVSATGSRRQNRARDRRAEPAPAPARPTPARVDARERAAGESGSPWIVAPIGLALALLSAAAIATAIRRRRPDEPVAVPNVPTPPDPTDDLDFEAELRELLAEADAERRLTESR